MPRQSTFYHGMLKRTTTFYYGMLKRSTAFNYGMLKRRTTLYYGMLKHKTTFILFQVHTWPRGLTFPWCGCCGLCLWHKPTELAHTFLLCSCVCLCLYGPFNCISFHKFSRQLPAFSLYSSGLISALFFWSYFCPIGPFNYVSLYESLPQPWYHAL